LAAAALQEQSPSELIHQCHNVLTGTAKGAGLSGLKRLFKNNTININSSMGGGDLFIGKSSSGEYMLIKGTLGAFIRPKGKTISLMPLHLTLTLVTFFQAAIKSIL